MIDSGKVSGVVIRQAHRSDADRMLEFIKRTYGRSASYIVRRWPWQFLNNPFDQKETIPLYIAMDGEDVVGITSGIPMMLKVGNEIHQAEWSCELMVDPKYRGQGLGLGLTKAHAENTPIFIAVRMAPSTRYIEGKIGCVSFNPLWVYVRFAGVTRRAVFEYLRMRTARRARLNALASLGCRIFRADVVVAGLLNAYRILSQTMKPFPKVEQTEICEVDRFGLEVDRLWEVAKQKYGVIVKRDHVFLNWKALDHPYLGYRGFQAWRDGKVTGYSILRFSDPEEPSVGHIIDLFADRDDKESLYALIQHAIGLFGKERAVLQCETTIPEFEQALKRYAFHKVGSIVPTYRCLDPEMNRELDRRKSEWFITRIDQDLDQLRPMWTTQ